MHDSNIPTIANHERNHLLLGKLVVTKCDLI